MDDSTHEPRVTVRRREGRRVAETARALYVSLGFREIAPYRESALPGVRYHEPALAAPDPIP